MWQRSARARAAFTHAWALCWRVRAAVSYGNERAHSARHIFSHSSPQSPLSCQLLAALTAAQSSFNEPAAVALGTYPKRVEALRKRIEGVSYTMERVKVRLDSLQTAITKQEERKNRDRVDETAPSS